MGFISLLSAKTWVGLGIAAALVAFLGWGALALVDSTRAACERDYLLSAAQSAKAAQQAYLAATERGESLSRQLAHTQRRLNDVKTEYLVYANSITGHCPDPVRVLAHYAARGEPLPAATGAPADASAPVSAAALGANIAENYARCHANTAQLSALIDWHKKKDLKHE